jgi:hypothetical protein
MTVLCNQFIVEGASRGESGIVAVFEQRPNDYLRTTPHGEQFGRLVGQKKLEVLAAPGEPGAGNARIGTPSTRAQGHPSGTVGAGGRVRRNAKTGDRR